MARKRKSTDSGHHALVSKGGRTVSESPQICKKQKTGKSPSKKLNKTSPATTFTRFLELPPEIRLLVLKQAVQYPAIICLHHHSDRGLTVREKGNYSLRRLHVTEYATRCRSPLAIAFTNRQTYLEACKLYYSLNSFKCRQIEYPLRGQAHYTGPSYQRFFDAIGPDNSASLTHFAFTFSYKFSALSLVSLPPNLKVLQIKVREHTHYLPTVMSELLEERPELAVTIKFTRICCPSWSDAIDDFKETHGMTRKDGGPFTTQILLSRPAKV